MKINFEEINNAFVSIIDMESNKWFPYLPVHRYPEKRQKSSLSKNITRNKHVLVASSIILNWIYIFSFTVFRFFKFSIWFHKKNVVVEKSKQKKRKRKRRKKINCKLDSQEKPTVIDMKSNERFTYATVLEGPEKRLVFIRSNSDCEKKIAVFFPENCVLGKRHIHLEVFYPKDEQKLRNGEQLITPVVFISLEKHTMFIRRVKITLPFISNNVSFQNSTTISRVFRKELTVGKKNVTIKSFYFSPSAVAKVSCLL